ncbi:DUF1553 domain-containing protein [Aureliella helgolandensis]|nr:DUF1553 domain-containing protein [Aureliella helgolandensis]
MAPRRPDSVRLHAERLHAIPRIQPLISLAGMCIGWWLMPLALAAEVTTAGGAAEVPAASAFRVFPAQIDLTGAEATSRVLVQEVDLAPGANLVGEQITESLRLHCVDPGIAQVIEGVVYGVSDGQTELVVQVDGRPGELRVPVEVTGASEPVKWQFNAHVQSILARQGCNSGACHGALSGKGGFRLSLHGYDSIADHFTVARQDRGRRIEPADPGRSLLLAKPTGLIPHKGGERFKQGSRDYRVLADWIAAGSPGPQDEDAELERVEVLPRQLRLAPEDVQQLLVRAHYRDGRTEDVTHWAKFSSANETVAEVDETGRVRVLGAGKGAIVVWFSSRVEIASVIVPYQAALPAAAYEDFRQANFVDEILLDEWKALGLAPSAGCSDTTFLRRATLNATGILPTASEVRQFLADTDPAKRQKLVDRLLASEGYVDYWSYKWSDLLLVNGNLLRPDAVAAFYSWIRQQVEQNTPWDHFVREIVTAKGESLEQGATNFYAIHQDAESLTENTCQAFMGLSIGCAKCHNHPLEKWTNDQYYAMANLYSRVRAKGWGGDSRNGDGKRTLIVLDRGDLIQPSRGEPQQPRPLDAEAIPMDAVEDRRIALANWLTSPENENFRRSIANRVWANFMGVGLVESVDDLRVSNPASSEVLLDRLADFLLENQYDLKALMRVIMNSQVYQRSSQVIAENASDQRFYSHYYPQRLMAEVLHDGIVSVTGVPSSFTEIEFSGADKKATEFYPAGTRSLELYDSAVANYFLKTFGRNQRRITCECERSDQSTVVQALHLNNGDTINDKLSDEKCIVGDWIREQTPIEQVVEAAYLSALSRFPSEEERRRLLALLRSSTASEGSRREAYEDLLWSLMTSPEFLFSH